MQQRRMMFLSLTTFSSTGGIEKFNRAFLKAMIQLQTTLSLSVYAAGMYDRNVDNRYIPEKQFRPFYGQRIRFVISHLYQFFKTDELILGHLNLALLGKLFKLLFPQKKLIVICHGIEVFDEVAGSKKKVLQQADVVLCVSNYTKEQLITKQGIAAHKIVVFPNTIDPFFELPQQFNKPQHLLQRYSIDANEKVLFTLTRLNHAEGYKGYDKILKALPALIQKGIQFKYILAGKADEMEKEQVMQLVKQLKLEQHVILTGFIADEEVTDHYLLADVYVMPSKGEGFGVVYLEAMACGLPVIAGNKDGSTEALQFGKLGILIDPDDEQALKAAIIASLSKDHQPQMVQQNMLKYFSFEQYTQRLKNVLQNTSVEAA